MKAMNVVPFNAPRLYAARRFEARTIAGQFAASGTLCGHVDFVGPFKGTYTLSPDEILSIIIMLQQARADVLSNSEPLSDPRIV